MRKTICNITIATGLALLSPILFAADGVTYTCTMDGTQDRVIKVVYKEDGATVPCEVAYTKDGETKSLWRYENTQGECEKKAEEFAEKQRAWGMTCNTGAAPAAEVAAPAATEAPATAE
jgi:hypothetical protein